MGLFDAYLFRDLMRILPSDDDRMLPVE